MARFVLICGIATHLILLRSIFDIYFTSPIIHGMETHVASESAPAKRLVLIVSDGLRPDHIFRLETDRSSPAPFIRNLVEKHGVWGVSHTRVPTESRPGHVALIAGFYEDVSAIATGWKENPVEFDSVFNESRYTWSWGSPDILPMFAKGASGDHVYTSSYSSEEEDFMSSDPSQSDAWVFDRVKIFLQQIRENKTLENMVNENGVILFLHLLAMDTVGHALKPWTAGYTKAMQFLDTGLASIVADLEEVFRDGKTAYVFTADHGMTDWGAHGSGDPEETMTPFVAWGAGIRRPITNVHEDTDVFSKEWGLSHLKRTDVQQADIAALMASLIGVPFPVNSIGVLPYDVLNTSEIFKCKSLAANVAQIAAQYIEHWRIRQAKTLSAFFRPYSPLLINDIETKLTEIENNIVGGHYDTAVTLTHSLLRHLLEGIRYFHTYDRHVLITSVVLSFLAWMMYIVTILIQDHVLVKRKTRLTTDGYVKWLFPLSAVTAIIITVLLLVQRAPIMYYAYFLLPVVLFTTVLSRWTLLDSVRKQVLQNTSAGSAAKWTVIAILALEILVVAFFARSILSVGVIAIGAWPLYNGWGRIRKGLMASWMGISIVLAVFPLLPTVGKQLNYTLVCFGGWFAVVLSIVIVCRFVIKLGPNRIGNGVLLVTALQGFILVFSVINVHIVGQHVIEGSAVSSYNRVASWIILGSSMVLPLFGSKIILFRLFNIFLSLFASYLLLSIAYEVLFILGLFILCCLWLCIEHELAGQQDKLEDKMFNIEKESAKVMQKEINVSAIRLAYLYLFFCIFSFFGTGNIASINSFDPRACYCFVSVFSPFTMTFLLIWKILVPFLAIACTCCAVQVIHRAPVSQLLLIALIMSDILGLHFFFFVKDVGSWLDIGTSISHYVISISTTVGLMVFYFLGSFLTGSGNYILRKLFTMSGIVTNKINKLNIA